MDARTFYIPGKLEDLERADVVPNGSLIANPCSLAHVEAGGFSEVIDELKEKLAGGVQCVVEEDAFNLLYTLLTLLSSMQGDEVAKLALLVWTYMNGGTEQLEHMSREARDASAGLSQSQVHMDAEQKADHDVLSTSVRFLAYATTRILTHIEKVTADALAADAEASFTGADGGDALTAAAASSGKSAMPKAKRAKTDKSRANRGQLSSSAVKALSKAKEELLKALVQTLSPDVADQCDTAYLGLLLGAAARMFLSPHNLRSIGVAQRAVPSPVKEALFELFLAVAKRHAKEEPSSAAAAVEGEEEGASPEGEDAAPAPAPNQAVASLADVIARAEHFPKHAAALCKKAMAQEATWGGVLADQVVEAVCHVAKGLEGETAEAKNIGAFLSELCDGRGPASVASLTRRSIPTLNSCLQCEAYSIRKAVLLCFSSVVSAVGLEEGGHKRNANAGDNEAHDSESTRKTKRELLEVLSERIMDTNAWVRVGALNNMKTLFACHCLTMQEQAALVEPIALRLKDKNSFVRQAAMSALGVTVASNLVGDVLRLPTYSDYLNKKVEEYCASTGKTAENVDDMLAQCWEAGHVPQQLQQNSGAVRVFYYYTAVAFIRCLENAVPHVLAILASKSTQDILEAVKLLAAMIRFKVTAAVDGMMKLCVQVFNREQVVSDAVVAAFVDIVAGPAVVVGVQDELQRATLIAQQIIRVLKGASAGEVSAVSRILARKGVDFCEQIIDATLELAEASTPDSAAAMQLFSILSDTCPDVTLERLDDIAAIGIKRNGLSRNDLDFATYTCNALHPVGRLERFKQLPPSSPLFVDMCMLLLSKCRSLPQWVPVARSVLQAIYALSSDPEKIITQVVKKLRDRYVSLRTDIDAAEDAAPEGAEAAQAVQKRDRVIAEARVLLGRLLFTLGETAVLQLVVAEKQYKRDIQDIHSAGDKKAATAAKAASPKRGGTKRKADAAQDEGEEEDAMVEELGMTSKGALETEVEARLKAEESRILGSKTSVWGIHRNLVVRSALKVDIATKDVWTKSCAVLALCLYMMVSEDFAKQYVQYLFSLLQAAKEPTIRTNIIISIGDLLTRFPNTMEPWTGCFFSALSDPDVHVRSTAYLVSSHLILNDMLKARHFVHTLLKGLTDESPVIQGRAALFLREYSARGERVFTGLPDTLSALSRDRSVTNTAFRLIMKSMIAYVGKEKQLEVLTRRLCLKFTQISQGDETGEAGVPAEQSPKKKDEATAKKDIEKTEAGTESGADICDEQGSDGEGTTEQPDDTYTGATQDVRQARHIVCSFFLLLAYVIPFLPCATHRPKPCFCLI